MRQTMMNRLERKREKNSGKGEKLENKIRSMDIGKKTWRKASEIDARDPAPESNN